MGEIVEFTGQTTADIPADKILSSALGKLDQVVVIGIAADGEFYSASSSADLTLANYLASKFIHKIHSEYSE